ncbi:SMI1/KNR4 family protein [Sphingomonas parva]|uniref:SMI1/KNR4 family protein n=1 Tax=Sphingomonas parva TaxID=2555898 RepID=A0A4Y8ZTT7_9SPHN|nr:SMI1/KNR4 family protein [Sphingomonas parva]TFI58722.1 SMI1/KNR4 family protein [Sphingomonas parva]
MLTLPAPILAMTQRESFAKATAEDVHMIRSLPPLPVPESYIELITRYGYLTFDPVDDPCRFAWEYREPELSMQFKASIAAFMPAEKVKRYYSGLVLDEDEDLPKFPNFMLPIGTNWGQNNILLECGGERDRIWFWEFQPDAWGEGDNVRLGFVADSLAEFLAKLHVPEL